MINGLDVYKQCGERCARARARGDEANATFEKGYYWRMRNVERTPADQEAARKAFDDAYRETSTKMRGIKA